MAPEAQGQGTEVLDDLMDIENEPTDSPVDDTPADEPAQPDQTDKPKPEIDWSAVDPQDVPHEIAEQTRFGQGMLREVQDLRQSNKDLTHAVTDKADAPAEQPPDPLIADDDDDEVLTKGEAKAMLREQREVDAKEANVSAKEQRQQDQDTRANDSYRRLQTKYPADKTPKGLDAATVIHEGATWLARERPALYNAAMAEAEPAQELYDLAVALCPTVRARQAAQNTRSTLDDLKRPSVPRGGGGGGTPASSNTIEQLMDMPEDQLLADIESQGG